MTMKIRKGNAKEWRKAKTHSNTPGPERASPEGQEKRKPEADRNGPRPARSNEDGSAKTNLPSQSVPGNAQGPNLLRKGNTA